MSTYAKFLATKGVRFSQSGVEPIVLPTSGKISPFNFQRDIINWAVRLGRAAVFADCGMGKTLMQLEWARQICRFGNVLILCPLAVAEQTVREAEKLGITAAYHRDGDDASDGITVTNYEMLDYFDPAKFAGVVIDESSILKNFTGATRNELIKAFAKTPYRLACTATPAPNDFVELGNHSEFLGALTQTEMLATFFYHDGGDTSEWRLKGHAQNDFWEWVCSWAVMLRKPSDLGYDDGAFILPKLTVKQITVNHDVKEEGFLFAMEAKTLQDRIKARRNSISARVAKCAEIVNDGEQWVIWCNLNSEADELEDIIPGAKQVSGGQKLATKLERINAFEDGSIRVLITKPSIAGHGLNWQHCRKMAFVGLSDSWEEYYQAVRRCWRFGQTMAVRTYIITSSAEGAVVRNIQRKEAAAIKMAAEMTNNMKDINKAHIKGETKPPKVIKKKAEHDGNWSMYLGDCVEEVRGLAKNYVDYSIFSPPFASLYTYSASERDMGNCRTYEEFERHFSFLIPELFRVLKPGRNLSFHCMDLPLSKTRDGVIGLRDFRGTLIRQFEAAGFVLHSQVTIWKDPVTAMQRTKALGLLWKQIKKDSVMSRMGIPDYLVTMRKPGKNTRPVSHTADGFPVDQWQKWASPVWMDINPSNTLQFRSAREHKDERHICPLQLEVIRRALVLWSARNDIVLSPFAGIGSEGFESIKLGRKFVGVELKESYYKQAVANLKAVSLDAGGLIGV